MSFRPIQYLAADPKLRAALSEIPRQQQSGPRPRHRRPRRAAAPEGTMTMRQIAAELGYIAPRSAARWCAKWGVTLTRTAMGTYVSREEYRRAMARAMEGAR